MLQSEGLNKYVDPGYLQHELSEATGLSNHELDVAAHQLMSGQNRAPQQSAVYPHRRDYDGNVIWEKINISMGLVFIAVCEYIIFGSFTLPYLAQPQFGMAEVWHGSEQSFHIFLEMFWSLRENLPNWYHTEALLPQRTRQQDEFVSCEHLRMHFSFEMPFVTPVLWWKCSVQ